MLLLLERWLEQLMLLLLLRLLELLAAAFIRREAGFLQFALTAHPPKKGDAFVRFGFLRRRMGRTEGEGRRRRGVVGEWRRGRVVEGRRGRAEVTAGGEW